MKCLSHNLSISLLGFLFFRTEDKLVAEITCHHIIKTSQWAKQCGVTSLFVYGFFVLFVEIFLVLFFNEPTSNSGLLKFIIKHRRITCIVQQTRELGRKTEKDLQ